MSKTIDRLKTKKGIAIVVALIAGIAFIVFGFEISPDTQGAIVDGVSGVVSE